MAAARIRALTLRDVDRILRIDEHVTGVARRGADTDLWRLLAETTTCFGADVSGTLAGFVLADVRPWEFGNRAHVGWVIALGVDPKHQKRGLGRLLGNRVLEEFQKLGVSDVKTLVEHGSPELRAYFEALGFRASPETVLRWKGRKAKKPVTRVQQRASRKPARVRSRA